MPVCQCGPLSVSKVPLTLMLRRCRCRCWDRCTAMHTIQHKLCAFHTYFKKKTTHTTTLHFLDRSIAFSEFSTHFLPNSYRLIGLRRFNAFSFCFFSIHVYSQAIKIQSIRFDSIWILIRI